MRSPPAARPLLFAVLGALLVLHAAHYWPFLSDDALIALSYARRWATGRGLTWTTGERVEGYTDFLWVVLVGVAGRLGFDYIWTARALDFIGALSAVALVGVSPVSGRWLSARLAAGGSILVASAPIAVWSIGALEHGFMAGVLALGLLMLGRSAESQADRRLALACGLPLAALALLRADGIVLVASALVGACCVPRRTRGAVVRAFYAGVLPAVAVLGQLAFRRWYYDAWQPNSGAAKLAFTADRLLHGLAYVVQGHASLIVALVLAAIATALLARAGLGRRAVIPWAVVTGWSLYLLIVGGDIFPGWRQLVFVVVGLAFVVAAAAEQAMPIRRARLAAFSIAVALHAGLQFLEPENRRAKAELWEWDGYAIGTLLKTAFGAQAPLLAVDAAGALPWWSELPSLDMLGINDRYLAHHPPPGFGTGKIGHELGDGAYVLSRAPDVIAFNNAAGARNPSFLSGRQMLADPEFSRRYQCVRVQGPIGNRAFADLWIRREGGKLGVVRAPERVAVPGYFFSSPESKAVSRLDEGGRLVARISATEPGLLPTLELPAGRYRLRFAPDERPLRIGLACGSGPMARMATGASPVLDLERPTSVSVELAPRSGSFSLERLEFIREPEAQPTHRCPSSADPPR
jgi:hypothetical protein